jgi:hypothetical protein
MSGASSTWQGLSFVLWVLAIVMVIFLWRHPLGQAALAQPGGSVWMALSLLPLWLGWTLGWPRRWHFVGLLVAAGLIPVGFLLQLRPIWAAGLGLVLPLPFYLGTALGRRERAPIEWPTFSRPPITFTALPWRWLFGDSAGNASAPVELPTWTLETRPEWSLDQIPDREVALTATVPSSDVAPSDQAFRPPKSALDAAVVETGPAAGDDAASRDPAIHLAGTTLDLLKRRQVTSPALHLESGPRGTALDLWVRHRQDGHRISELQHAFEQALGARVPQSLHGRLLRLTFPAHARGERVLADTGALWVPLGLTAPQQRLLANLMALNSLLLVGRDPAPLIAATHTILGAALGGVLGKPPRLVLVEVVGRHLDLYTDLPGVQVLTGSTGIAQLKEQVLARDRGATMGPPTLALILLPPVDLQDQIVALLTPGPSVGIYPLIVADTPAHSATQMLASQVAARLVFAVGGEESRYYLRRRGAEDLGAYEAIYCLDSAGFEPVVLKTYRSEEETIRQLLEAKRSRSAERKSAYEEEKNEPK